MLKILHTGDLHTRDKDIEECRKCLSFIVEQAEVERPGLIVVAGDTFHGRNIPLDSPSVKLIFEVFSQLAAIAPVAVVTGTPIHDGQTIEVLGYVRARFPVYVATMPGQVVLMDDGIYPISGAPKCVDAVLSFVPTPTKQFFQASDQDLAGAMSPMFAGFGAQAAGYDCPHVLIGHFQARGARVSSGQTLIGRDIEISRDQIALANADLVCLGHIHMAQEYAPGVFYCGDIYREKRGETEAKGFYVHDVGTDEIGFMAMSKFIETPARKLATISVDLCDTDLMERNRVLPDDEIMGASVKVDLDVWQDEASMVNPDQIKEYYLKSGAESVEINLISKPRENVRSQRVLELESLRDKVKERAALNREEVPAEILAMCDRLETETPDEILAEVAKGGAA